MDQEQAVRGYSFEGFSCDKARARGCVLMGIIDWEEVEYPAPFTSAMASVQQGFQQFHVDRLKVVEFFNEHQKECEECRRWDKKDCKTMKQAKKEIGERFAHYKDFFGVIRNWQRISRWAGDQG